MTAVPPRRVPSTPFGDDDGAADPRIVAALAAYERGEGGSADVLAALAAGRLLIPVVAVAESVDATGAEKETAMAAVLTTGRDGRRGLLAFTCVESLIRLDLIEMLGEEGYEVVGEAADGASAVRLAEEHRPDLVV
ncbi:SseB family protein, partial [Jiangella aurantiaca]|uniref:SseB family protein n=1 Tax=Jiangella aurantiaca TaxID=2530373 RepID=UPI00193DF0BB